MSDAVIKKFRAMPWKPWLKRHFPVLVSYLLIKGGTKEAFAKIGIKGEIPISLYERDMWWGTEEMFRLAGEEAAKYLQKTDATFLADLCVKAYKKALRGVQKMLKDKTTPPLEQYKKIIELLNPINVHVWTAHSAEVYYNQQLKLRLADYVAVKDLDQFIGDVGYPKRKNAHTLMVDDIIKGVDLKTLHERYAWLKSRTFAGFAPGYTMAEMKQLQKNILKNPPTHASRPPVPAKLKKLVVEFQDLVFLRTLRTDALWEINFRAQPVFARLEKQLGIDSVANYLPDDLLKGKLDRYGMDFAILKYYDDIIVIREKIASSMIDVASELKGAIAWAGKTTGRVKIVHNPSDAEHVKEGEILVTNMTVPAYLLAMKRAAAFVTDEGGITCHAAILAREMKKPCVIGTKVATKVLRDGDLVEVDADRGIVKKI